MDVYEKLKALNLTLPAAPAKGGVFSPAKQFGAGFVYISGCGPSLGEPITGKLGQEFTTAQGYTYAGNAVLNMLAVLQAQIGDLNLVKSAVKLLVFVAGTDTFYEQPKVANGGSQVLADLFGAENVPARSAIGVNALPGNIPVEIEAIFELKQEAFTD